MMTTLLLLGLLLVASYYLWRALARRKQRQRVGSINGYLFPSAIRAKIQRQHAATGLDASALLKVEAALRQFFRINSAAGKKRVAMPSQLVDDYWHEFILHTREYQRFCKDTLGRFLHHTPASGMAGASHQQQAIQRAWVLACRDEGINPQRADRLPLLFGIDALFGIAGGYHSRCNVASALMAAPLHRSAAVIWERVAPATRPTLSALATAAVITATITATMADTIPTATTPTAVATIAAAAVVVAVAVVAAAVIEGGRT